MFEIVDGALTKGAVRLGMDDTHAGVVAEQAPAVVNVSRSDSASTARKASSIGVVNMLYDG